MPFPVLWGCLYLVSSTLGDGITGAWIAFNKDRIPFPADDINTCNEDYNSGSDAIVGDYGFTSFRFGCGNSIVAGAWRTTLISCDDKDNGDTKYLGTNDETDLSCPSGTPRFTYYTFNGYSIDNILLFEYNIVVDVCIFDEFGYGRRYGDTFTAIYFDSKNYSVYLFEDSTCDHDRLRNVTTIHAYLLERKGGNLNCVAHKNNTLCLQHESTEITSSPTWVTIVIILAAVIGLLIGYLLYRRRGNCTNTMDRVHVEKAHESDVYNVSKVNVPVNTTTSGGPKIEPRVMNPSAPPPDYEEAPPAYENAPPQHEEKEKLNETYEGNGEGVNVKQDLLKSWFLRNTEFDDGVSEEYFTLLVQNGFDTRDVIRSITDEELKEIGVQKMGHRKQILAL